LLFFRDCFATEGFFRSCVHPAPSPSFFFFAFFRFSEENSLRFSRPAFACRFCAATAFRYRILPLYFTIFFFSLSTFRAVFLVPRLKFLRFSLSLSEKNVTFL
jgi:hypothetical protein